MADVRGVMKVLARHDREDKSRIAFRRRYARIKRRDIDRLLGMPDGWTRAIEARDSDPRLSELRLYKAAVTVFERVGDAPDLGL